MSVDLSVMVLHYNRWDLTKDCLASIDAQEIPCTYEKVLVDNGSERPWAVEEFLRDFPDWNIYRVEKNR